jgi:hypothetical protein
MIMGLACSEARLAEIEMAKSIDAPILFNNTKLKNLDKRQVQVSVVELIYLFCLIV